MSCVLILSVLCFNFVCWYGSLTVQDKNHLLRITTTADRVIGLKSDGLDVLYTERTLKKAEKSELTVNIYFHINLKLYHLVGDYRLSELTLINFVFPSFQPAYASLIRGHNFHPLYIYIFVFQLYQQPKFPSG